MTRRLPLAALSALMLAACTQDGPLPGERIPVRPAEVTAGTRAAEVPAVSLPQMQVNPDWSHRNGSAVGRAGHPALRPVPELAWSADIGAGETRRSRILTGPVVAGGLVFAMDAAGTVSATTRTGARAWSRSIVPEGQLRDGGPGGGMAVSGGRLFVATGFGEVFALDPASGGTIWREAVGAPVRAAPVVSDGRVYVVARDDTARALDGRTGETLWRVRGAGGTGLLGGASPAADAGLVVFPFASGEVLGVLPRNGARLWGTAVTGGRRELVRNRITDISGDPVIAGGVVYASNQSGRTIAIDRASGERAWTMPEGAYGPAWPAGGSLFLLSDEGTLVRARTATGEIVWSTVLPEFFQSRPIFFGEPEPTFAISHYGPVLAGGRLWVASADGALRGFRPADGRLLVQVPIPGGAASAPAVAGGVMYVVSRDGRLHAFQ